jgi:hypothetical protein
MECYKIAGMCLQSLQLVRQCQVAHHATPTPSCARSSTPLRAAGEGSHASSCMWRGSMWSSPPGQEVVGVVVGVHLAQVLLVVVGGVGVEVEAVTGRGVAETRGTGRGDGTGSAETGDVQRQYSEGNPVQWAACPAASAAAQLVACCTGMEP